MGFLDSKESQQTIQNLRARFELRRPIPDVGNEWQEWTEDIIAVVRDWVLYAYCEGRKAEKESNGASPTRKR